MNSERLPDAGNNEEFLVGLEILPSPNLNPVNALKRWLKRRREDRHFQNGSYAAMHGAEPSDRDRFHGGPDLENHPSIIGLAAEFPAAAALDHARRLEAETDPNND